jgi:periplasmic protein TonB
VKAPAPRKCLDGEAGGFVLGTLLESNARRPRRRAGLVASIVIHTLIIGGALAATAAAKSRNPGHRRPPPPTIIYTRQDPRPAPPKSRVHGRGRAVISERRLIPHYVGQRITYVSDSLFRQPVDIAGETPLGIDSLSSACLLRCRLRFDRDSSHPGDGGRPATIATVDRAAALVSPPRPRYPELLRAAGVTGRVIVRLVVDTLGRVEPGSIVVRESSHDLFAGAVRAILPALRFVPAEAGGRRVRMLVDLPFEFRLNE